MKKVFLAAGALLLVSCAPKNHRSSLVPRALPNVIEPAGRREKPAPEGEREDSPGEAAEFYLLKRTGGAELPVERLLDARRHAQAMPLYSIAARRFVESSTKAASRGASLGGWQLLGPGNVGGRTRSLVIRPDDPKTMYAGSVGGGVWKTTDGGATWNPLTDLIPSIGISTLAMDPQNPDTLYAGTGEWYTGSTRGNSIRGAGIFKTTDGGATWTQLPGTTNNFWYYVNKVVVSPRNGNHVYVANWTGVWFSPDAGATWRNVINRGGQFLGCQDLAIRSDLPADYIFAACAYAGANAPSIYRNQDAAGAGAWEAVFTIPDMGRTTLAIAPSDQSVVYAAVVNTADGDYNNGLLGVFRSESNGDPGTWEMRVSNQDPNRLNTALFSNARELFADVCSSGKSTFINQGAYDNSIAVDPLNQDIVWIGGTDIFRSTDGGRNWGIASFWQASAPQLAHADIHAIVFSPAYDGNGNRTLFAATDGGLYRTDNALAATATGNLAACPPYTTSIVWKNINNGYAVTQFYHGAVFPGGAAYQGGSQDNGMLRGSDASGPLAWTRISNVGDGGFSAIDPADPNIAYGENNGVTDIVRTTTGWTSFFNNSSRGITEPNDNFLFIAPLVMDPNASKRLYIGGKTLWRSVDGAMNWSAASSPIPGNAGSISDIAISPADPEHVVFGTSTGFVFTNTSALEAGRTTDWSFSQPRSGFLSHIAFDPADDNVIYVTFSQYKQTASQSHVYKSADGGATWTGIDGSGATGLPDIPAYTLIVDPQNTQTLYLGTDIGVFVSLDGGATWSRDDNPFADAVTETLVLDRSSGQSKLFAFTHGRGVWRAALPGSGGPCQYSLSTNSASTPAFGGPIPVSVSTGDGCAWSAIPANATASVASPAGGKGSGPITINVAVNNTASPRSGAILVQNQAFLVQQEPASVASGNDDVSSPFPMGTLPAVAIEDSSGATESSNDPVHSCTQSADSKTLWFEIAIADSGMLRVTYSGRRFDRPTNSGIVLTTYATTTMRQTGCFVIPQSATTFSTSAIVFPSVSPGQSILIELSATTFGAPEGAEILPGNLTLTANLIK